MNVTVVVATYGSADWHELALSRAIPSAEAQGVPVVSVHCDTLHDARNCGLSLVRSDWVSFLDADDELEPGYIDAMSKGNADLRAPSVRYVDPRREWTAHVPRVAGHTHDCEPECLAVGNWLVVGAVARTRLLRDVGGWHDFPVYEDYDLWARCWLAGASIERIPDAVYRAHVRPDSRNRGSLTPAEKHAVHQDIARANGLVVPA